MHFRACRNGPLPELLALAGIHGGIGADDDRVGAIGVDRIMRDADAGADIDLAGADIHRLGLNLGEDAARRCRRALSMSSTVGDDDGELVPAEAGDQVGGADGVFQAAGDLA